MINKKIYNRNLLKTILIFLILFIIFFLYQIKLVSDNFIGSFVANTLVLIIFLLSIFNIKYGLYLFIFFIPLLNSFTTIVGSKTVPIILFLFFSLCLGFVVNKGRNNNENNWGESKNWISPWVGISKPILVFIIIFGISSLIAIFRYSNFFPFITNRYYDLIVNANGVRSTGSIFWTIRYFFNYIIGFGLIFVIFNVLKKIRDIVIALIILITSTIISSLVGFYQYFFNPYFGSISLWVDQNRLNATFTDPNALGSYTLLVLPVFISCIFYFKKWYLKLITGLLLIPILAILFLSGSRSAFLGLCISLLVFVIFGIWKLVLWMRLKFKEYSKLKKVLISTSIIILSLAVIFMVFNFLPDVLIKITPGNILLERIFTSYNRAANAFRSGGEEIFNTVSSGRDILWGQAINMTSDYPISGVGLGAYIIELPNYYIRNGIESSMVDFTGNYYLQILSELGFPGLILVLIIFIIIIKKGIDYFRSQGYIKGLSGDNWLITGFFISFFSMSLVLFFGPHTNFDEVQFTFWLIIGFMLTFIMIKDEKTGVGSSGKNNRISFDLIDKISLIIIIIVFATSSFMASFTNLSINIKQNLYGYENNYGFYEEEVLEGKKFRWTGVDASEVIYKNGSIMIIPIRAATPGIHKIPVFVRVYVDNTLIKVLLLRDDLWHDIKLDLPNDRDKVTLTISAIRSWVPKEWGVSDDTRRLGVMVGDIEFLK